MQTAEQIFWVKCEVDYMFLLPYSFFKCEVDYLLLDSNVKFVNIANNTDCWWFCCYCRQRERLIGTFQIICYLFKIWLPIRPFSRKEASVITNIFRIAYVDFANYNCDIVVVVDADGDPLVHFKSTVTYSQNLFLIRYLFRKYIITAYVDVAYSKCDVCHKMVNGRQFNEVELI